MIEENVTPEKITDIVAIYLTLKIVYDLIKTKKQGSNSEMKSDILNIFDDIVKDLQSNKSIIVEVATLIRRLESSNKIIKSLTITNFIITLKEMVTERESIKDKLEDDLAKLIAKVKNEVTKND